MEEGSRRREVECANMTVTKHSSTNENSNNSYNDKLIHTILCTSHEEQTKVSSDGETERNILCRVDDPESSPHSQVENLCLLDNIGEIERDRVCVEPFKPSEGKENRNISTHNVRGDDHDVGKLSGDKRFHFLSMLHITNLTVIENQTPVS